MGSATYEFSAAELDELIEIHSYEEMKLRPLFDPEIDSDFVRPIKPLGYYPGLLVRVRCGRSGCHKQQLKGLLVLCSNGRETNIGYDCAKKLLDFDWDAFIGEVNQKRRQKETLEGLRMHASRASEYHARHRRLIDKPYGANWLLASLDAFKATVHSEILMQLSVRAARRDNAVLDSRLRTDAELDQYDREHKPTTKDEGALHRYRNQEKRLYVEYLVGQFEGIEVFVKDGYQLIFVELAEKVREAKALHPDELSAKLRRKHASSLKDLDEKLNRAESWVNAGTAFFTPTNKALLPYLMRQERRRLWDPKRCQFGIEGGVSKTR